MNAVGDLNLWAVGYDDPARARARAVRAEVSEFESRYGLQVLDAVLAVRQPDGTFALERDRPLTAAGGAVGFGVLGLVVGLVLLEPLAAAALAAAAGGILTASARRVGGVGSAASATAVLPGVGCEAEQRSVC